MTARPRVSTLAAVLASAALIVPLVPFRAGARPAALTAGSLAISVQDITPTTLPTAAEPKPLTVTLAVTNHGTQQLNGVTIEGERGEPITTQAALEQAMRHVSPPHGSVVAIQPTAPVRVDVPPGATQTVVFRSTTSTSDDGGLCNCAQKDQPLIYPLYFTGHVKGAGGAAQTLGLATTFVSAFAQAPAPVHVSWVWPLIDQPHLLEQTPVGVGGPVFSDDFLAASIGTGGRLDRALGVAEQVAHSVPLTLVIDPELLNELEIMASGPYQVVTGTGTAAAAGSKATVPGRGKALATAWLLRLHTLLGTAPTLRVQLTPYADPDVESLHAAQLSWSSTLPETIRQHVEQALGGHSAGSNLAWPAGGALSRDTLKTLVGTGVTTVLVNSSAVAPKPAAGSVRPGLARLTSGGDPVTAGLLDPAVDQYVEQAVTSGGAGTAVLPQLVSELAVRAVQEPRTEHVAVLAAPRWVDASVATAARVIKETSRSLFARPIGLDDADSGDLLPSGRSHLTAVPASARTLPQASLDAASGAADDIPALTSLLTPARPDTIDPRATALLDELPLAAQRVTASAWGRPGNTEAGTRFADQLNQRLYALTHGVIIVKPSSGSGSYTLTSDNSPLPITVHNNLPYQVSILVEVTSVNGLPGFAAKPRRKVVDAHQKATVSLQTNIERTGRFRVQAALWTADGQHRIGDSVGMTVRSTALGVIGLIITFVAGAVLALALIIRAVRRVRHRRGRNAAKRPRWDPDAENDSEKAPPEVAQPAAERTP